MNTIFKRDALFFMLLGFLVAVVYFGCAERSATLAPPAVNAQTVTPPLVVRSSGASGVAQHFRYVRRNSSGVPGGPGPNLTDRLVDVTGSGFLKGFSVRKETLGATGTSTVTFIIDGDPNAQVISVLDLQDHFFGFGSSAVPYGFPGEGLRFNNSLVVEVFSGQNLQGTMGDLPSMAVFYTLE